MINIMLTVVEDEYVEDNDDGQAGGRAVGGE